jgi:hypothetical protein
MRLDRVGPGDIQKKPKEEEKRENLDDLAKGGSLPGGTEQTEPIAYRAWAVMLLRFASFSKREIPVHLHGGSILENRHRGKGRIPSFLLSEVGKERVRNEESGFRNGWTDPSFPKP